MSHYMWENSHQLVSMVITDLCVECTLSPSSTLYLSLSLSFSPYPTVNAVAHAPAAHAVVSVWSRSALQVPARCLSTSHSAVNYEGGMESKRVGWDGGQAWREGGRGEEVSVGEQIRAGNGKGGRER